MLQRNISEDWNLHIYMLIIFLPISDENADEKESALGRLLKC